MKQALILVALLVAFATPAAAQSGTVFGAKVGINFSNLSFDPDDDDEDTVDSRTGFLGGIFMVVPVNARFAFQPELLYSQQGAKESEGDGKIGLDYINIPLLANINLASGNTPVSLLVGPQIGFRVQAKLKDDDFEEDIKDDIEGTDWGLVTGVSATVKNFVLDARYTWGLSNINALEDDTQKVKHRVFSISVGILFR